VLSRASKLLDAYFAAIVILVFGALCFNAGLFVGCVMAAGMLKAAT
jgi:hypothetical protein